MIQGRAHVFGDHIDTDGIIPAACSNMSDPSELGRHCMENIDPDFARRVSPGDILVAGSNFGCGSSREFAPWAIKGAGISCVIAKSFARIFFRNAINIGLPVLTCPAAAQGILEKDLLEVDLALGRIGNLTRKTVFTADPYPEFIGRLVAAGGLLEYARRRLAEAADSAVERPK